MAQRVGATSSRKTWGALVVVAAAVGGTIWALRSPSTETNAPSNVPTTTATPSGTFVPPAWLDASASEDFVPSAPLDPARPDAEPPKVSSKECPAGQELFDDKTQQGTVHGCGRLDPATKLVVRDGFWSIAQPSGNRLDGRYVDGKREGAWVLWNPSGRAIQSWDYKDDKYDGWQVVWNDAGQKMIERHFKDGMLDGDTWYLQPDGSKRHEVWKEGKKIEPPDPAPS